MCCISARMGKQKVFMLINWELALQLRATVASLL